MQDLDDGLGGNLSLLNTIKLPKNLKLLTDRLPKSKYDEESKGGSSHTAVLKEVKSTKSLKNHNTESGSKRSPIIKSNQVYQHMDLESNDDKRSPDRRSAVSEERK